eukprot:1175473-Prorocentrum_minimum.AAC.2
MRPTRFSRSPVERIRRRPKQLLCGFLHHTLPLIDERVAAAAAAAVAASPRRHGVGESCSSPRGRLRVPAARSK